MEKDCATTHDDKVPPERMQIKGQVVELRHITVGGGGEGGEKGRKRGKEEGARQYKCVIPWLNGWQ